MNDSNNHNHIAAVVVEDEPSHEIYAGLVGLNPTKINTQSSSREKLRQQQRQESNDSSFPVVSEWTTIIQCDDDTEARGRTGREKASKQQKLNPNQHPNLNDSIQNHKSFISVYQRAFQSNSTDSSPFSNNNQLIL